MNRYDDIINLPRYEIKHKRMSIESRSAQFAPFSALTGYDEKVKEVGRITQNKIELSNEQKENISDKLNFMINKEINKIKLTYFIPDDKKTGGQYVTKDAILKKIDIIKQEIIFLDKTIVPIQNIVEVDYE